MAHLKRCYCGRQYRCDFEHQKRSDTILSIDLEYMACQRCPEGCPRLITRYAETKLRTDYYSVLNVKDLE